MVYSLLLLYLTRVVNAIYEIPSRGAAYKTNWKWFREGKDCEVLRIGVNGWKKGKMRIKLTVEFIPDEPEIPETPASKEPEISQPQSPLDDIRRIINQESQP
ncbi:hypothetical protein H6F77_06950 [Microcoleus sp. FACHB-831]|nr:hypothetical protein [Microcoleus sp. FACHB-831]